MAALTIFTRYYYYKLPKTSGTENLQGIIAWFDLDLQVYLLVWCVRLR